MSESDEADSEVQRLTAMSFHSLSCPDDRYYLMHAPSAAAAPSMRRPRAAYSPQMTPLSDCTGFEAEDFTCGSEDYFSGAPPKVSPGHGLPREGGKGQFECPDFAFEKQGGKPHRSTKTVPKRQILLKRKGKQETKAVPVLSNKEETTECSRLTQEDPEKKERLVRAASHDEAANNSRFASGFASHHVTSVLTKKMQREQCLQVREPLEKDGSLPQPSVHANYSGWDVEEKAIRLPEGGSGSTAKVLQNGSFERSPAKHVCQHRGSPLRDSSGMALDYQFQNNTSNDFNHEKVGELRNIHPHAYPVQRDSGDANLECVEKRGSRIQVTARSKAHELKCKALDASPNIKKSWLGRTERTARRHRPVLQKDDQSTNLLQNSLPPASVFTSKTPQIKLMPQANVDQKNSTFSICRLITLQRKAELKTSSASQECELSPLAGVPSSNDSKDTCDASWEAQESSNKPQSWQRPTRDVSKLKKETYSAITKTASPPPCIQESKRLNISEASEKGPSPFVTSFIQSKAISKKDYPANAASLQENQKKAISQKDYPTKGASQHENQMYGNGNVFNGLKASQCSLLGKDKEYSAAANTHTKNVDGLECTPVNKSLMGNMASLSKGDGVDALSEKKAPDQRLKNELAHQTQISELKVQRTSKTENVAKKESHLNFRVNSKSSSYPDDLQLCSSSTKFDQPSDIKEGLQSPYADPVSVRQDSSKGSTNHYTEATRSIRNNSKDSNSRQQNVQPQLSRDNYNDSKTEPSLQKNVVMERRLATLQESRHFELSPLYPENGNGPCAPNTPTCSYEDAHHKEVTDQRQPTVARSPGGFTNSGVNNSVSSNEEPDLNEKPMSNITQKLDKHAGMCDDLMPPYCTHPGVFEGYNKKGTSPSDSSVSLSASTKSPQLEENSELSKILDIESQVCSPAQPGNTPYLTIPFQERKSAEVRSLASTQPKSTTASSASSTASSISNFSFFSHADCETLQSSTPRQDPQDSSEKSLLSEPFENIKSNTKQPQLVPGNASGFSAQASDEAIRCNPSLSGRGIPCGHHTHIHRKMLIDPESGKYYYIEPPRHPQLKVLFDPETGQYIEALIPPVPVASHTGFYQAPFPPVVLSPDCYGSPYVQYPGYPGFSPAVTIPPVHAELQSHPHRHGHQGISGHCSHLPKLEVHANQPDNNPLERLYYIPTGMTSSPTPTQPLPSQVSCCSPNMVDKGHFCRMPFHQTHSKAHN